MITYKINTKKARDAFRRLRTNLSPEKIDETVKQASEKALQLVVSKTPKRWFGNVRAGWKIEKLGSGRYRIVNQFPKDGLVMFWLEYGTANKGTGYIRPKTKQYLYIPLKSTAVKWHPGLKYGKDYILRKKVKGIKPRMIVGNLMPEIEQIFVDEMQKLIRKAING